MRAWLVLAMLLWASVAGATCLPGEPCHAPTPWCDCCVRCVTATPTITVTPTIVPTATLTPTKTQTPGPSATPTPTPTTGGCGATPRPNLVYYRLNNSGVDSQNPGGANTLSLHASATYSAAQKVEGTHALAIATGVSYADCNLIDSCTKLNFSGPWSLGCFARPTTSTNRRIALGVADGVATSTAEGYLLQYLPTGTIECVTGTSGVGTQAQSTALIDVGDFGFAACSQAADGTMTASVNGAAGATDAGAPLVAIVGASHFQLSDDTNTGTAWRGQIDACVGVNGTALSTAELLKIANCDIDSSLCACDPADPGGYQACDTDDDCPGDALCADGACNGRGFGLCTGGTRAGYACLVADEMDCPGGTCVVQTMAACNAGCPVPSSTPTVTPTATATPTLTPTPTATVTP